MFWNKKLIEERNFEQARAKEAFARLDAKSRECDRLIASVETAVNESAKDRQISVNLAEVAKNARALADKNQNDLEKCRKSLDHFCSIVNEIHTLSMSYSPIQIDGLKNNSTLKNKLKEAQSLIVRIFEKSKGSE